jgi:hypothetical protein
VLWCFRSWRLFFLLSCEPPRGDIVGAALDALVRASPDGVILYQIRGGDDGQPGEAFGKFALADFFAGQMAVAARAALFVSFVFVFPRVRAEVGSGLFGFVVGRVSLFRGADLRPLFRWGFVHAVGSRCLAGGLWLVDPGWRSSWIALRVVAALPDRGRSAAPQVHEGPLRIVDLAAAMHKMWWGDSCPVGPVGAALFRFVFKTAAPRPYRAAVLKTLVCEIPARPPRRKLAPFAPTPRTARSEFGSRLFGPGRARAG